MHPTSAPAQHPAPTHTTAAVLSVGDELLLGQIVDTNSAWLGQRLTEAGLAVREHAAVGDDLAALTAALQRLAATADVVVITGGLGPTADDLTRQAVAAASGDALIEDPVSLEQIRSWFAGRGREMSETNRVQALRPTRATALANHHGTAPGLHALIPAGSRSCDVFCIPGPPAEMRPMFEQAVLPRLRLDTQRVLLTRSLHCIGIGESDLAALLGPLMDRTRNPLVGTNAGSGQVTCRLRYDGRATRDEAERLMDETERAIRAVAGDYIFGAGDSTLAQAIIDSLRAKGQTVGVVESCTGGLLGGAITHIAGSSVAFMGGLQTYTNELKVRLAGVPKETIDRHGAVSPQCADAMAAGGRAALSVDWCLAVTGIAGPGGAVPASNDAPAKPVGTVYIALAGPGVQDCRRFAMGGDREAVRRWSVQTALAMLWLHLAGRGSTPLLRQTARDRV